MAIHLGVTYGDGPSWFYRLSREDQTRVVAYHRIRRRIEGA